MQLLGKNEYKTLVTLIQTVNTQAKRDKGAEKYKFIF